MANTFLTPSVIAREALATLYSNLVMGGLVWRDFDGDFNGAVGDTVTIRKPATFTAQEFARPAGINLQDATETGVPVTLDTLLDVSFAVTTEQMSMEIKDFGEQLLNPAMEAIAQAMDQKILTLRADVTQEAGNALASLSDPKVLVDAGRILNLAKVPQTQRYTALDSVVAANFVKDPLFHQADQRGDTAGLREASIGRKFGFDNFESQNIVIGAPTESVAFHRTAFALVSRTLPVPRGAGEGRAAIVGYKGLGLRVVYDYDINQKQDIVSIDTLIGVKTLDADRAVLLSHDGTAV